MANNCMFEMRVAGSDGNVAEFARKLIGLGRVYTADVYSRKRGEAYVQGDCAWSLEAALGIELKPGSEFRKEIARLGLSIEAYSSEPGIGFQEHYVLEGADLLTAEETGYEEHWFGCDDDLAEETAEELGVDVKTLLLMAVDDGCVGAGGYRWSFDGIAAQPGPTLEELKARAAKRASAA